MEIDQKHRPLLIHTEILDADFILNYGFSEQFFFIIILISNNNVISEYVHPFLFLMRTYICMPAGGARGY